MRRNLTVDDLGDLLELPITAIVATYQQDGLVRLSPVWHEWRDGGFSIVVGTDGVIARHLRRDPRITLLVYDNEPPWRGIEVRGEGRLQHDRAEATDRRMAARYLSPQQAELFAAEGAEDQVVVRIEPGELRAWDFADEFPSREES